MTPEPAPPDPKPGQGSAPRGGSPSPEPPRWRWVQGRDTIGILLVIGCATFIARVILDSSFAHSALLYLGVPYLIALLLHIFVPIPARASNLGNYLYYLRNGTIVMFLGSAILFEGFLCVVMFMPLYYGVLTLVFLAHVVFGIPVTPRDGSIRCFAPPALILVLSLEGMWPATSLPRAESVGYRVVVSADVASLRANMARPIAFDAPRHWFLAIFPLPGRVSAGSLTPGDVHALDFTYRRWIVANTHHGTLRLKIEDVGPGHVRTRVIENDSYLATYLDIVGTDVRMTPLAGGGTAVDLIVHYRRNLDPAWYFGPLQRFAVMQSARYLIETVIARETPHDGHAIVASRN